jgi:hypothetical protein
MQKAVPENTAVLEHLVDFMERFERKAYVENADRLSLGVADRS